ncbi:MAG: HAMP domain-containing histidine kinase [Bacteroidales bacterium]|nr:HAMP domain-containing histidine kinase [Bacteroidales bacterium]
MTILMLGFINFGWFFNNGSSGPMLGIFILYLGFMVLIWEKRTLYILASITLLNITVLFFIEFYYTDIIELYASEHARLIDVYVGLFFALGVIFMYSYYAKYNYRKQLRNAQKSDELKTSFLANISHEIRTPLNAIIGFSGLINRTDDEERRYHYGNIIKKNGYQLQLIFENILDISMIESGQMRFIPTDLDLNELLQTLKVEAINECSLRDKNNIKINCEIPAEYHYLFIDKQRLQQVLQNLVSNAIKFTNSGTVSFGYRPVNKYYQFYVKDTGIGIRPENFEKVFKRFSKIEEEKIQLYRGAGLGLYVSKKIIELLGGKIWFTSVYGKGTSFFFQLPKKHFNNSKKTVETILKNIYIEQDKVNLNK